MVAGILRRIMRFIRSLLLAPLAVSEFKLEAVESEPLYFHSYWRSALPLRGTLRIALVAVAVGVCAGAVVRAIFDTAVFNRSATHAANQANLPISVQTETVKSQSGPVKSPVQPTSSDQAQDLAELNELKAKIWEAEAAQRNFAAGLPHCSELNGTKARRTHNAEKSFRH